MRYTSCTVEIDLFDTSAQIDGTLSTNDSREISDVTKIKHLIFIKWQQQKTITFY